MTVRAILFEDLDETSPLYGAMAMGTQGLEISKTRTADGRNWDWTTAMTAEGIMAGTIIAGIISDKTGKSWWNLDTGEMQMTGRFRQFTSSGLKSVDIHDNKIDLFAWDSDGHYVGSFRAGSALDKSYKSVGIVANCGDRVTLGVLKEGEESGGISDPVFSGSKDFTAMYAADGKGNKQEIISAAFDDEVPYIRGGANGFFSACGERVDVQSGLITNITEATAFSGTLDLISGLGWNGNGITEVDRTKISIPGVYAIGDLIFGAQLAHAASAQGIQVAEQLAGKEISVDVNIVPGCVYTDPEIASVGMTEDEAKEKGIAVKVGKFIMSANGKSLITKEERGFIKVVAEEESGVIVGAQMMCARATDMIGEFVTAVANNMTVSQLLKGMRAHPTYNEGIGEALEELEGGAIHVMPKKKK